MEVADGAPRGSSDSLYGHRPKGSKTRFWGALDDSPSSLTSERSSPSTASMRKMSDVAGFSVSDIDLTTKMLEDLVTSAMILASSTPTLMVKKARKIVFTLFENRRTDKPWSGPLRPPRVSPPMTLGACMARAQCGGSSW